MKIQEFSCDMRAFWVKLETLKHGVTYLVPFGDILTFKITKNEVHFPVALFQNIYAKLRVSARRTAARPPTARTRHDNEGAVTPPWHECHNHTDSACFYAT